MQVKNIFKPGTQSARASETASNYQQACRDACATYEGASALAKLLQLSLADVPAPLSEQSRLLRRQMEAAKQAAQFARVRHDLDVRIPSVLQRDEAQAKAAMDDAARDVKAAQKEVDAAQARAAGFGNQASELQQQCDAEQVLATKTVDAAQHLLSDAQAAEDMDGIASASELVADALQEQERVRVRQGALRLRLQSIISLVGKAEGELELAQKALDMAQVAHLEASDAMAAVNADRSALDALVSYAAWMRARKALPVCNFPAGVDNARFIFLGSERGPFWNGGDGSTQFFGFSLNSIMDALADPDWSRFAQDPAATA